jgi:hypothetical protein
MTSLSILGMASKARYWGLFGGVILAMSNCSKGRAALNVEHVRLGAIAPGSLSKAQRAQQLGWQGARHAWHGIPFNSYHTTSVLLCCLHIRLCQHRTLAKALRNCREQEGPGVLSQARHVPPHAAGCRMLLASGVSRTQLTMLTLLLSHEMLVVCLKSMA